MQPRRKRTRVEGIELHWVELGEGPPLVLLHGLADSHRTWRRALPQLAKRRRVLALDLPGHGLSERPDASYDIAWHARLAGQWCDYLQLDDFDLVGHSFGGGVAQFMLLSHAHRMRRLGLVASGGLGREVALALRLLALPITPRVMQPFMRFGTWLGARLVAGTAFEPEDRRWLARANGAPGSAHSFAATTRGVVGLAGQTMHFLDHANRITTLPPMSLFWGDRDPIIPIRHGEHAARMLKNAAFVRFEGAGHFPHLSAPQLFADALSAFLDDTHALPVELSVSRVARLAGRLLGHRLSDQAA